MTAVSAPPTTPKTPAPTAGGPSAPVSPPDGAFGALLATEESDAAPRDKTVAAKPASARSAEASKDPAEDVAEEKAAGDAQPVAIADGTAAAAVAVIPVVPPIAPETQSAAAETSATSTGLAMLLATQTQPAAVLSSTADAAVASDQSFETALASVAGPQPAETETVTASKPATPPATIIAAVSEPAAAAQIVAPPQTPIVQPDQSSPAVQPSPPVVGEPKPAPAIDAVSEAAVQNVTADTEPPQAAVDLQGKQAIIATGADKSSATLAAPAAPGVTAEKAEKTADQPSADKDALRVNAAADKPVVAARRNDAGGDPTQSGADQGKSGEGAQAQSGATAQPDASGGAFTLTQGSAASGDGSPDAVAGQAAANAGASTAATVAAGIAAAAANAGAGSRRTRLEVRLDESDLGRIDVRLDISQDGRMSTRLMIDRPETLAMLRNDASELTKNLQQAGFTMNGGGLSFELRDGSGQGFAGRDQQQASGRPVIAADAEDDLIVTDQVTAAYRGARSATSALDVRV